jgi:hypothetical protein
MMAKGQLRQSKEKKKPKADKNRPKQVSAYKQAQMQGGAGGGHVVVTGPGKKV